MRLDSDHEIVCRAGEQPICAEKVRYFEDPKLSQRTAQTPTTAIQL